MFNSLKIEERPAGRYDLQTFQDQPTADLELTDDSTVSARAQCLVCAVVNILAEESY